ncbi:MAG: hypothetical protein HQL41_17860 [Alphaproteobacteria bacterium]|nr:hypothetical protein [Alphaproteobacteria bacterium]
MPQLPPEREERQIVAEEGAPRACDRRPWVTPVLSVVVIDERTWGAGSASQWDGVGFVS